MTAPRVSICSSVYNRAQHVAASISSMLAQDAADFEVVVIDDGSTDDTLQVVRSFDDQRLRLIVQENTGFTRAIDRAVRETRGEYVAIVDGGDICLPERIRVQARYLDDHPHVGAVGSWVELDERRSGRVSVVKLDTGRDPSRTLLSRSIFWHSEVMFRKSLYEAVGGYRAEFYYSQDNDLWLRMSERSQLAIIPQVLHRVIKFENGISTTPEKLAMARAYRAMAVHCARERRAGRPDPVTRFGRNAMVLRPRSRVLANRLAVDGLKSLARGDSRTGSWLTRFAVNEKLTLRSVVCLALAALPGLPTLRTSVLRLKKLLRGGSAQWLRPVSRS